MKAVIALLCLLAAQALTKDLPPHEQNKQEGVKEEAEVSLVKDSDPCEEKYCEPGHECDLDENNNPICVCTHQCPEPEDSREKACSTQNVTFASECELYRQKCLCHKKQSGCLDRQYMHAHLDYYGECKGQEPCEAWELEEFPGRMRMWLYLVMDEMANRNELSSEAATLVQEARTSSKQWVLPVIWKFCDLDVSHDRLIASEELQTITASLKPIEHCMSPFLAQCDVDKSGYISLHEWGKCLGLEEEEIEDRCETLRGE